MQWRQMGPFNALLKDFPRILAPGGGGSHARFLRGFQCLERKPPPVLSSQARWSIWNPECLWNSLWITLCITSAPLVDNSFVVCVIILEAALRFPDMIRCLNSACHAQLHWQCNPEAASVGRRSRHPLCAGLS